MREPAVPILRFEAFTWFRACTSSFRHTFSPTPFVLRRSSLSATSRCSRTIRFSRQGLRRHNWIKSTVGSLGFGAFFAEWTCALMACSPSTGAFSIGCA